MPDTAPTWPATRAEALTRLASFLPRAGAAYALNRNADLPGHPHVSTLSPYLRHRIVTEDEVARAVLAVQSARSAGKFLDELYWRVYWKGWLERRPTVWTDYRRGLGQARDRLAVEAGLRVDWAAACRGETGIEGFDDWARELAATGYLHNHARMWFASIWIFTLRLPWELGADFFLRHLLDGDPASNTLSWRWVAGLQTPGKSYAATADNIARFTGGRFRPRGLAAECPPMPGPPAPPPGPVPRSDAFDPAAPTALLVTEEDLSPRDLLPPGLSLRGRAMMAAPAGRSPLAVAPMIADPVTGFVGRALADLAARDPMADPGLLLWATDEDMHRGQPAWIEAAAEALEAWARACGALQIVTPWPSVGPVADRLARIAPRLEARGLRLVRMVRAGDARAWPHATAGFFRFRAHIPDLLAALDSPSD
jgi:deoxyribodipyrimidine photo-lyase